MIGYVMNVGVKKFIVIKHYINEGKNEMRKV